MCRLENSLITYCNSQTSYLHLLNCSFSASKSLLLGIVIIFSQYSSRSFGKKKFTYSQLLFYLLIIIEHFMTETLVMCLVIKQLHWDNNNFISVEQTASNSTCLLILRIEFKQVTRSEAFTNFRVT